MVGAAQPHCSTILEHRAGGPQVRKGGVDGPRGDHRAFAEPRIEMNGQGFEHVLMGGQRPRITPLHRVRGIAGFGMHLGRPVDDVLPVVTVLGHVMASRTGRQRGGEVLHLQPTVVDVELAHHFVPAAFVEAGHRIAVASAPAMAGVQGPGRVGTHELDNHPGAVTLVDPGPTVGPGGDHIGQDVVQP